MGLTQPEWPLQITVEKLLFYCCTEGVMTRFSARIKPFTQLGAIEEQETGKWVIKSRFRFSLYTLLCFFNPWNEVLGDNEGHLTMAR